MRTLLRSSVPAVLLWALPFISLRAQQLAAGEGHSLVICADSTINSWGTNYAGRLGDGSTDDSAVPVSVVGVTRAVAVAAGNYHSMALDVDGSVWTWGDGFFGQLGNGSATDQPLAMAVNGLTDVVDIEAGNTFSVALRSDGTVWTWGDNSLGELGIGTVGGQWCVCPEANCCSSLPVQVHGPVDVGFLTDIIDVAAGSYSAYALHADGTIWSWGYNGFNCLGSADVPNAWQVPAPVSVSGPDGVGTLSGIVSIAAGSDLVDSASFCLALDNSGAVWGLGANTMWQIGSNPQPGYARSVGLNDVTDIACGAHHAMARKSDGSLWMLGSNRVGALGQGTLPNTFCACGQPDCCSDAPVQVVGPGGTGTLANVVAMAGGYEHSMARDGAGNLWTWGANYNGQLGDGTTDNSGSPVAVGGLCALPTGVPRVARATIGVRPNPTAGPLVLDLPEAMHGAMIQLFDGTGRVVLALRSTGTIVQLDVSSLSPGVYQLLARSASDTWSGRVLKE